MAQMKNWRHIWKISALAGENKMLYTYPHYYRKFQCIASECEDTCCAGWEIMIDDKALEKYKKAKGPVGNSSARRGARSR